MAQAATAATRFFPQLPLLGEVVALGVLQPIPHPEMAVLVVEVHTVAPRPTQAALVHLGRAITAVLVQAVARQAVEEPARQALVTEAVTPVREVVTVLHQASQEVLLHAQEAEEAAAIKTLVRRLLGPEERVVEVLAAGRLTAGYSVELMAGPILAEVEAVLETPTALMT